MKFKVKDIRLWSKWFAWYPVFDYNNFCWLWLETIERRTVNIYTYERGPVEYREVLIEKTAKKP